MRAVVRLAGALLVVAAISMATDGPAEASAPQWSTIAAGENHTCAIRSDASLYCWGYGADDALGDGTILAHDEPKRIGSFARWRSVTVALRHSCAILTSGALYCWCSNDDYQLGDGSQTAHLTP